MLFTYKEFEQTKQQIFEQFKKKPAIDVDCLRWDSGFIEYRKILNNLKSGKKNKSRTCQSATRFKNSKQRPSENIVLADKNKQIQSSSNFYMTEAILNNSQNHIPQSRNQRQTDNQLLDIIIKLSQYDEMNSKLKQQTIELENSIRFFKKKNSQLQWKLHQQQKQQTMARNLLLKKKNQLNSMNHKNSQIKQKLHCTQRFFGRSLKSIKNSVQNNEKKAMQMMQQVVETVLTNKKLSNRVQNQASELAGLDQKMESKKQKLYKMQKLFKQSRSLIWATKVCTFIKQYGYGQIQGIKALYKTLEYGPTQIFIIEQQTAVPVSLMRKTKDLLKVFKKMQSDQIKLKQIYQSRINQQKQLHKDLQNMVQSQSANIVYDDPTYNLTLTDYHHEKEVYIQRQLQKNIKRFSDMLLSLEQRTKFLLRKDLKLLIIIVQNWLKYDQSAFLFINDAIEGFIKIINQRSDNYAQDNLKNDLQKYFQNWQKYLFFSEDITKNSLASRGMSKSKISNLLRRIVKTKIHKPNINTQQLFLVAFDDVFCQNLQKVGSNIRLLWQSFLKIYSYASKFQVLIVNSMDTSDKFRRTDRPRAKIQYPMNRRRQIQNEQQKLQNLQTQSQQTNNNEGDSCEHMPYPELVNIILDYQEQLNKISKLNKIARPKTNNIPITHKRVS